jgi:hypothetical protein
MHADIFDRYHHSNSLLHRLDPRIKVVIAVFILSNALGLPGPWIVFLFLLLGNLLEPRFPVHDSPIPYRTSVRVGRSNRIVSSLRDAGHDRSIPVLEFDDHGCGLDPVYQHRHSLLVVGPDGSPACSRDTHSLT